jgi:hypothetical protein
VSDYSIPQWHPLGEAHGDPVRCESTGYGKIRFPGCGVSSRLRRIDWYLLSHEVYLYIFDALLMLVMMALFNWAYPTEILSHHHKSTQKGVPSSYVKDNFAHTADPRSRR